jgi:hypothetical protein
LTVKLTETADDVTTLPNASSTATAGWPEKTDDGVALATPVGWTVNASWAAAPKLVTEKLWLCAGTAASDDAVGLAVALIVYCVAVVGGFLAAL